MGIMYLRLTQEVVNVVVSSLEGVLPPKTSVLRDKDFGGHTERIRKKVIFMERWLGIS